MKKKKLLIGNYNIKQNQYYSDEVLKLLLNELKTPKRISTIAENLNRCRKTIRDHMLLKDNSYYKQRLIRKCGKERGARCSFYGDLWTLTEKGRRLL